MVWNDIKDEMLCKEILLFEPFKHKQRTKERGNAWTHIAGNLNQIKSEDFNVDQRAVPERFTVLKIHFDAKTR